MSKKEAAEKYFKLGEQKYNKKDYQGAIADYDKAIELNPKYAEPTTTEATQKMSSSNTKKLLQITTKP